MLHGIYPHSARNFSWRRSHWLLLLLWIVSMAFVKSDSLQAQNAETLKQRFLEDAPAEWEAYNAFAGRLQGTIVTSYTKNGQLLTHARCEIKQNLDCKLCMTQRLPDSPPAKGELLAINPNYSFTINRSSDNSPWILLDVSMKNKDDVITENANTHLAETNMHLAMTPLYSLVSLQSIELVEIIRQPTFQVVRVQSVNRDGFELVHVDFDNSHPVGMGKQYCPVQQGFFLLNPNRRWCLLECDVQLKYPDVDIHKHINIELRELHSENPIAKHLVSQSEIRPLPNGVMSKVMLEQSFKLEELAQLPTNAEFTLSAFGLPEPSPIHRPTRWYLWLVVAGILCLGVAALFRRLIRRGENSIQKPTPPEEA